MFDGYMTFGGKEIVNDARTAAYISSLQIPGSVDINPCPTLRTALGHAAYTTPTADDAPWYDSGIAESGQVAGFLVQSIDGLGDTSTRPVQERPGDGGVVGRRRRQPRELSIRLLAVAANECALSYAVAWLARVFSAQDCSQTTLTAGCASARLCVLTCCPQVPEDLARYQVSLYNTGVTSGPSVLRTQSTTVAGCNLALCEVEVVITAGDPSWYAEPVTVFSGPVSPHFVGPDEFFDITHPCFSGYCAPYVVNGCEPTEDILDVNIPMPCIGDVSGVFNHYSIPLDFSGLSSWMDLVPTIYYTASPVAPDPGFFGFEGPVGITMRRPTADQPCGSATPDYCTACMELFVPGMTLGIEGVFDFVSQKGFQIASTTGLCPIPVYGRTLAPFDWPTVTCGPEMCLDLYVDQASDGRAQFITFDVMRRQDAIA